MLPVAQPLGHLPGKPDSDSYCLVRCTGLLFKQAFRALLLELTSPLSISFCMLNAVIIIVPSLSDTLTFLHFVDGATCMILCAIHNSVQSLGASTHRACRPTELSPPYPGSMNAPSCVSHTHTSFCKGHSRCYISVISCWGTFWGKGWQSHVLPLARYGNQ